MIDMLGNTLVIGDTVAVPVNTEMKLGRVKSLGQKMAVLEPIPGHERSISGYRGGKRYFHDVIKVDL